MAAGGTNIQCHEAWQDPKHITFYTKQKKSGRLHGSELQRLGPKEVILFTKEAAEAQGCNYCGIGEGSINLPD